MSNKISIVMAYYNRRNQVIFTLKTINNSQHKNIEVIIVDDASDKEHQLDDIVKNYDFIKYIKIDKKDKNYINPCVVYNIGFREATGEIVIFQNPECCHIGDVIKYVNDNMKANQYFNFTCANLYDNNLNNTLYDLYKDNDSKNEVLDFINKLPSHMGNSILWYNHPVYRPSGFHFLSAIYKSELDKLGGFDERYAQGSCYDDAELIERIKLNNLDFRIIDANISPFVIHLWHEKSKVLNNMSLVNKNRLIFNEHMKELGVSLRY